MMKRHLRPVSPSLKEDECPRIASIFRPVYIILHASFCSLQATICHYNNHKLYQTDQFITAKIPGNALKQGNRTHSVLHQGGSQLQNTGCGSVSSNWSEDMRLGWRALRFESL